MTLDPLTTLRALNPAPSSQAPSIDGLWTRLDSEAGAPTLPVRRPVWGSRLAVALTVAVALAIAIGGVLVLRSPRRGAPAAAPNVSSLTRILGVLRRPQTPGDRAVLGGYARVFRLGGGEVQVVRSLARAATDLPGGQRVGLVPVVHRPRNGPAQVGIAIIAGGGSCCSTVAQIEAGKAYWSYGGFGGPHVLVVVVPDGVARVRYQLAHVVTVPVHDNVAVIRATVDGPGHHAMTWLAPDGSVIKRFGPPPGSAPQAGSVRPQPGDWRGGRNTCPRAPRERGLPLGAGCVSVVYADVDGDGRLDTAILYATLGTHRYGTAGYRPHAFWLVVRRASGGELKVRIHPTESNQFFLQHGNLNGVPGDELIVQVDRISSNTNAVIYTDAGGRLRREPVTLDFSGDSASMGGFTCRTGPHPVVIQHIYELLGQKSPWRDTTTTYAWRGATLHRQSRRTTTIPHLAPGATTLHRSCGTIDVPRPLRR